MYNQVDKRCLGKQQQLAHSADDLRLKEISEFLHGSEMNKTPTFPWPLQITECASYVQLNVWQTPNSNLNSVSLMGVALQLCCSTVTPQSAA